MKEIVESIINGQCKQALAYLHESRFTMSDLIEHLMETDMEDEVVRMLRVAEHCGYVKYFKKAVKE